MEMIAVSINNNVPRTYYREFFILNYESYLCANKHVNRCFIVSNIQTQSTNNSLSFTNIFTMILMINAETSIEKQMFGFRLAVQIMEM